MPGGKFDSSKTRVAPVFDALKASGGDWVRQLLALAEHPRGHQDQPAALDLEFLRGYWGSAELGIPPPVSLLSWLIRNPQALARPDTKGEDRRALLDGDPKVVAKALDLLRAGSASRAWYIFEGPTFPDAVIETPDALVVIEGKRTEGGPTTSTKWLPGRHQMWRHIDAAWERRGRRRVYGMFIVEGETHGDVPGH
jgi:hypothetical protein